MFNIDASRRLDILGDLLKRSKRSKSGLGLKPINETKAAATPGTLQLSGTRSQDLT
jgi:hypothetical protein